MEVDVEVVEESFGSEEEGRCVVKCESCGRGGKRMGGREGTYVEEVVVEYIWPTVERR